MADHQIGKTQTEQLVVSGGPPAGSKIEPTFATKFSLAMSPESITLVFFRPVFTAGESGLAPSISEAVSLSVNLSPILVKDLNKTLTRVIADYEKQVGGIPEIPTIQPTRSS